MKKDEQIKWTIEVILNNTYFKCYSSCLDNEVINRHFDLFWKRQKETVCELSSTSVS